MKTRSGTRATGDTAANATTRLLAAASTARPKRSTKMPDRYGAAIKEDDTEPPLRGYARATKATKAKAKAEVPTKALTKEKPAEPKDKKQTRTRQAATRSTANDGRKNVAGVANATNGTSRNTRSATHQGTVQPATETSNASTLTGGLQDMKMLDRDSETYPGMSACSSTGRKSKNISGIGRNSKKQKLDSDDEDLASEEVRKRARKDGPDGAGRVVCVKQTAPRKHQTTSVAGSKSTRAQPSRSTGIADGGNVSGFGSSDGPENGIDPVNDAEEADSAGLKASTMHKTRAESNAQTTASLRLAASPMDFAPTKQTVKSASKTTTKTSKKPGPKQSAQSKKIVTVEEKSATPDDDDLSLSKKQKKAMNVSLNVVYEHAEELGFGKLNKKKSIVAQIQKTYAENVDQKSRADFLDLFVAQNGRKFWRDDRYFGDLPIFEMPGFIY